VTYSTRLDGYDDECSALSDTAYRVHAEAINYLYGIEDASCLIPKTALRRFATSRNRSRGIAQLVTVGFWKDHGDCWEVIHHAGVIRKSLAQLEAYRVRNRRAQDSHRERQEAPREPAESPPRARREPAVSHPPAADLGKLRDISAYPRAGQGSSPTGTTNRPIARG
jgi:hypothetical protein